MCWSMSGSSAAPVGRGGPAQNHWHHYRRPWRRPDPQPGPEPPLDRYEWKTSARPAHGAAKMSPPEGKGHSAAEPRHLRMLSLPRLGAGTREPREPQEPRSHEGQARSSSLRRIFPYLRSMSEPGAGPDPERPALRKAGSDAERRTPSVSSFIHSFSRRISRVLRDRPEAEAAESGRRRSPGNVWFCS